MGDEIINSLKKKIKQLDQENSQLKSDLDILEKESEILKIEKDKNQNIIKQLSSWVGDLTNALLGKDSAMSQKLSKVIKKNHWNNIKKLKKPYLIQGLEDFKNVEHKISDI